MKKVIRMVPMVQMLEDDSSVFRTQERLSLSSAHDPNDKEYISRRTSKAKTWPIEEITVGGVVTISQLYTIEDYFFSAFLKQQKKDLVSMLQTNNRLLMSIGVYRNAGFWKRLKYLFKGSI
jgi:hypothetical protein